jgi:hypothetical protein
MLSNRILAGLLLCGLTFATNVAAQVAAGAISGAITDSSGGFVPSAQVSIRNTATGVTRILTANEKGFFSAPNLLPGTYEVTISLAGFASSRSSVELAVGAEVVANAQLKVAGTAEKVEVAGEAPSLDLASSILSAAVGGKTMRELPLNGRDWTLLATLEPGVHTVDTQTQGAVGSNQRGNRGWGTQITISGARPTQNNYRLDGVSMNDNSGGGPGNTLGLSLGVEAIQEFSVVTGNPPAEYGKTSGGVFNAITRTGTNALHGSLYEFLRNNALDARNFFDGASTPPFRRNQFGASGGAPIRKDRTFVFANYEGLRQSLSTTNLLTVPSRAARLGQLTAGTIAVNAKVAPFLDIFPLPNVSETGDVGTAALVQNIGTTENLFTMRVDHKISDADAIHGTFLTDDAETSGPDAFGFITSALVSRRKMAAAEFSHIFSPSLVNSARFGYSRSVSFAPKSSGGIAAKATDPAFGFVPGRPIGVITISGLTIFPGGVDAQGEYDFYYNSFQTYDDLFCTHGSHSLRFGFSQERIQSNQSGTASPNGGFTFGSLKSFLSNQPQTFTSLLPGNNGPVYLRQSVFAGYAQDDWRIKPNLTLNLGVRYEMSTVPYEKYGKLAELVNLTDKTPTVGPPYFENPTLRNFSPRVGFSWDPFRDGKTAIRAGAGLYDTLPLTYQFEVLSLLSAPFYSQGTFANPPAGTFPNGAYQLLTPDKGRVSYIEHNPKRSYVEQWNFNIQRQLRQDWTLQVGYTGSHGVHQPMRVNDANIVLPQETPQGLVWPTPRGSGARLNGSFGTIQGIAWQVPSSYNALNARLQKRFTHGFQAGASYTWSKSIDTNSATVVGAQFANSLAGLPFYWPSVRRGLSDFDVRHSLVVNYLWEIPGPRSVPPVIGWFAHGWQASGIIQASSGHPFTIEIASDPLGLNNANPFAFPDRLNTPNCESVVNPGNPTNYIKTECFAAPTPATRLGNGGRNSAIGPGVENFNLSLFKNNYIRRLSETFNVQFRAEFFNALNHTNFLPPLRPRDQVLDQNLKPIAGAGLLTATSTTSRQIQFAIRVIW